MDRKGNLDWLTGHFAKSPLAGMVPVLLSLITVMELAAGALSAIGCAMVLLRHDSTIAFYGVVISGLVLLALVFRSKDGERISRRRLARALFPGRHRRRDLAGARLKRALIWVLAAAGFITAPMAKGDLLAPPPAGKFYQGFFYSAPTPGSDDANEHNVTAADVARFEKAIGKKAAWIYFSDNWFESRVFPGATCRWIQSLGKVPYLRLMLRSSLDQKQAEREFSLTKICAGDFDEDLKRWAEAARSFRHPLLLEWGTEPNGEWFSWNGKWHGRVAGPALYVQAYRHIVDVMRAAGADNLQWVWHVNWDDVPETHWNRMENYFPGADYFSWFAVSAYGPLTPRTDEVESFREELDHVYPRLTKLAPGKPIILAEFGCEIHHRGVTAADWARAALQDLYARRWPAIIGFSWWNESWENDDVEAHNSDLNILHDPALKAVFREELEEHRDRLQERPLFERKR